MKTNKSKFLVFTYGKNEIVVRVVSRNGRRRRVGTISRDMKYVRCEAEYLDALNAHIAAEAGNVKLYAA